MRLLRPLAVVAVAAAVGASAVAVSTGAAPPSSPGSLDCYDGFTGTPIPEGVRLSCVFPVTVPTTAPSTTAAPTTTSSTTTTTTIAPTTTTTTTLPAGGVFVETFDDLDGWVFDHWRYAGWPPPNGDAPSTATIVNGQAQIYAADQDYGDATLRAPVRYNLTAGGTVSLDISDNSGGNTLLGDAYVMFSNQTWDAAAQMQGERAEPYAPNDMPTEGVTVRLVDNCRVPSAPPVVVTYSPAAPGGRTVQRGTCAATPDGTLRLVYTPGSLSIRNGANAVIVAYAVTLPTTGWLTLGVHNHASDKYGALPAMIGLFDNVTYPI